MPDEVLNAPPQTLKKPELREVKKFKGAGNKIVQEESDFLPPLNPEEEEIKKARPGLMVQEEEGKEATFEPSKGRYWDARQQRYREPYKEMEATIPSRPDISKTPAKFPTRDEFEQFAFQAIGGNPFEFDPHEAMKRETADLKPLFNYVFRNKVYWGDRDQLTPEQQQFWDATVKSYRSQIYSQAENYKKQKVDLYNHMLSKYSDEVNERKAAQSAIEKRQQQMLASIKERRISEKEAKTEKRAGEYLGIAKERLDIYKKIAAKKGEKTPTRSDIQAVYKDEAGVLRKEGDEYVRVGGIHTGEQLSPEVLEEKNAVRRAAGMPELVEIVTSGTPVPSYLESLPGIGRFFQEKPGPIYKYVEEQDAKKETKAETKSPENIETIDDLKEAYPDAREYEGKWYVPQSNGKYLVFEATE